MEVKSVDFTPRLTAPSAADKYYLHTSKGGLNECIHINGGSCLPNCVGYAWGRFYEITGERPKLSRANAEMWYGFTADGYKRSGTPALGAIVCWSKGAVGNENDGAGHVAVVERIEANGDIVASNSAYGGTRFYMQTYRKSAGYCFGAYKFQGFILPPVQIKGNDVGSAVSSADKIKAGSTVMLREGAKDYGGGKLASFVYGRPHIVSELKGDRAVIAFDGVIVAAVKVSDLALADGKKSIEEIASEVIAGKWGNGSERKCRLEAAGYNYSEVQRKVNELTR